MDILDCLDLQATRVFQELEVELDSLDPQALLARPAPMVDRDNPDLLDLPVPRDPRDAVHRVRPVLQDLLDCLDSLDALEALLDLALKDPWDRLDLLARRETLEALEFLDRLVDLEKLEATRTIVPARDDRRKAHDLLRRPSPSIRRGRLVSSLVSRPSLRRERPPLQP